MWGFTYRADDFLVIGVADQADTCAAGAFSEFVERAAEATGVDVETSGLRAAAKEAEAAYAEFAAWLRSDLAPKTSAKEACIASVRTST